MARNWFRDFRWERDGNGNYVVTDNQTGKSLIAIPRLDCNKYCIKESNETELNYYNQVIPKRYNKFEVMQFLENCL